MQTQDSGEREESLAEERGHNFADSSNQEGTPQQSVQCERVVRQGCGPTAVALQLQHVLLGAALAKLGLHGSLEPLTVWCRCLGSIGVPSTQVRELFEILDTDQVGRVSPMTLCNADFAQGALVEALRTSLDMMSYLQLRYKLFFLGCQECLCLRTEALLDASSLTAAFRRLQLNLCEADAEVLLQELSAHGGGGAQPSTQGMQAVFGEEGRTPGSVDTGVPVFTFCHQLAIWSTSAAKLHGLTAADGLQTQWAQSGNLGNVAISKPPPAYLGKTPIEIVVKFKDPSAFPWHKLPEAVCGRPFGELWHLAKQSRHHAAGEAVRLLTDPALDRIKTAI